MAWSDVNVQVDQWQREKNKTKKTSTTADSRAQHTPRPLAGLCTQHALLGRLMDKHMSSELHLWPKCTCPWCNCINKDFSCEHCLTREQGQIEKNEKMNLICLICSTCLIINPSANALISSGWCYALNFHVFFIFFYIFTLSSTCIYSRSVAKTSVTCFTSKLGSLTVH